MRIFTPEWYERTQARDATTKLWHDAFAKHAAHQRRVLPRLDPSVQRLAKTSFHDCELREVCFLPLRTVRLRLTGFRRPHRGRAVSGDHELLFRDVAGTNLGLQHVGGYWGYEEVDKNGRAAMISVLLPDRSMTFWIRFSRVRLTSAPG